MPVTLATTTAMRLSSLFAISLSSCVLAQQNRTAPLLACKLTLTSPVSIASNSSSAFFGQGILPLLQDLLNFNATNHTLLPIDNIQGDILYARFPSFFPATRLIVCPTELA